MDSPSRTRRLAKLKNERLCRIVRLAVLLSLVALPSIAGNNRWTITGPEGGGVNRLAFDSGDPSIAYAATDNGLFRSTDGGKTWAAPPDLLGTRVLDVAVANNDPRKVFASTVAGLYKSDDRGVTWRVAHTTASYKVTVSPANANVVYNLVVSGSIRSLDGGTTFGQPQSGLPSVSFVSGLTLDPQNADTVYASFLFAGVYKSVDGGAHWTPANGGLAADPGVRSLEVDPSNGRTLYSVAGGVVYKTIDGATSWTKTLTVGMPSSSCISLAVSAASPATIIAGTNRGAYKTSNGGASWARLTALNDQFIHSVAIAPMNPSNVLTAASLSVFKSADGGVSFTPAVAGLTAQAMALIATDPRNASVVYASSPQGIFKSADRGQSWLPTGGPSAQYLLVDPFSSTTLYAIMARDVFRSVDGGSAWLGISAGLPSGSTTLIVAHPQLPETLYAISGGSLYRKTRYYYPWERMPTAVYGISFVSIDPHHPSTLFAGGPFGFSKSLNGGATWAVTNGPVNPAGLVFDPHRAGHIFMWSPSWTYESSDGGTNWKAVTDFEGYSLVANNSLIVFDPSSPGVLYANNGSDPPVRSVDEGKNWSALMTGLGLFRGPLFGVAPDGRTLYTAGSFGGVWAYDVVRQRAARH
jgi:photosystem II stability/assembly factor-like uncharacterized protein